MFKLEFTRVGFKKKERILFIDHGQNMQKMCGRSNKSFL